MWRRRRNQQQQQQICAFEVYLKQLAKVSISQVEMNNMMANEKYWPKSIQPNPYKVFIYTTEQLNDKNETRQMQFQLDLQHILHLKTPLMNFNQMPKSNVHWRIRSGGGAKRAITQWRSIHLNKAAKKHKGKPKESSFVVVEALHISDDGRRWIGRTVDRHEGVCRWHWCWKMGKQIVA